MTNNSIFLALLYFVLMLPSCRKAENLDYIIQGKIIDSRHQAGLAGVSVRIDEQTIDGGTLSGALTTAAQVTTAADGSFELVFPRKNALAYQINLQKTGYFARTIDLNPDVLRPNEPYTFNASLTPEATVSFRFINANPETVDDLLRFRKLNALFECACCNNAWVNLEGMTVDSVLTCKLHGDYNLTYIYDVFKLEETSTVDSVFCAAFQTTYVTIEY
jgi:hypothetical protein